MYPHERFSSGSAGCAAAAGVVRIYGHHGRRPHYHAQGTTLSKPTHPNDLWCANYKGEFMLADRRYCYPLIITDFASRYLLCCDALENTPGRIQLWRI